MIKTLNAIVYILSIQPLLLAVAWWLLCKRHKNLHTVLDFQKKILGPAGPQVFIFCHQNKYSGRQKLYLRINGFSFVKDNGLSLVCIFPKKKVTYLVGQVGDQAWKFGCHWVKAGRIGDPTGRNVEPWSSNKCSRFTSSISLLVFCSSSTIEHSYSW